MTAFRLTLVLPAGGGRPLPRFVVLSAGAHAAAVAVLLLAPGWLGTRKSPPLPTLDVSLVAPVVRQETARPAPPAPAPKPEPERPPEGPSATPAEPKKAAKPAPERVKPKPEEPKPEPRRAQPPQRDEPPPAEPDDAGESIGGPGGAVALEGMGAEFDWYRDAVRRALDTAWRRPFVSGLRDPLEVAIAFEILRDGTARGIRIQTPSGDSSLDRSAYRAVQEASLPPLPRNYRVTSQPAVFVFRLFPEDNF